jgi:hypothetical protein
MSLGSLSECGGRINIPLVRTDRIVEHQIFDENFQLNVDPIPLDIDY